MKHIIAAIALLSLAACTEDQAATERACFDKLDADFTFEAEEAQKAGNGPYAIKALESALMAAVILADDDRNVCDYVSAGPNLERKYKPHSRKRRLT